MIPASIGLALANHLWQSTLAAAFIGLLALVLRRNPARLRHWLWLVASAKFLVPVSLLFLAGASLRPAIPIHANRPAATEVLGQITQPFSSPTHPAAFTPDLATSTPPTRVRGRWIDLPASLVILWFTGFFAITLSWLFKWSRISAVVRCAAKVATIDGVPILSSKSLVEPGVFGIIRPALLVPEGLQDRLTASQLRAVIAHEICHIRRRDNLAAAFHMAVEALFWFHPLVWWMGARLVEERERACDEAVLGSGHEAETYAESILSVCKLCLQSPLPCVSGVTGADLKKRIVRIVTQQAASELNFARKLLLYTAGILSVAAPIALGVFHVVEVHAQIPADNSKQGIVGDWQGTLHAGKDLRTVLRVTKKDTGLSAALYSIDQGANAIPVSSITLQGSTVKYSIMMIDGSYEGKLSADGNSIAGTWTQGGHPLPLNLVRATPATAWALPEPPPKLKPMAPDANPVFEVATIKPTKPDEKGKGFRVQGRHFSTVNTSLENLLTFSYGIQRRQIVGGPQWINTDKFDIDAQPDGEGAPNTKQWKAMLQKLLADRFKLTFHHDKKELAVYALTVAKDGPKLAKSQGDPNGLPALFFRGLGTLPAVNANMNDFAGLLESAVLDRPVVNQTDLQGRFDFMLKWTPDESQFTDLGIKVPPPSNAPDAPPNLFAAMQEQLGLKLESTKASVDVIVIDHAEKPSEN